MAEEIPSPEAIFYQCQNDDICGAIFARPQMVLMFGRYYAACPECHQDEFSPLSREIADSLFWHIIAHDFTDEEWATYRMIVSAAMEPMIQPMDNDD